MKKIFIISIILLTSISSYATHIIGGDISYKNVGVNQYEFTVKIYRDCYNGVPPLDSPAHFTIYRISDLTYENFDVFMTTDSIIPPVSPSPCLTIPPDICVEEGTYVFYRTLLPSPGGYVLTYQRCCRNGTILNIDQPGSIGATYTCEINDDCLALSNNSAYFKNYPPIVICANQPLVFDHSAIDPDGDELVYELCQPYKGAEVDNQPVTTSQPPYQGVPYASPYTYSNPMDGLPPLAIDPATGLLTITPTVLGQFVVGICVNEFRNGVFLGRHLRDFQFNVVDCQPNVLASVPSLLNNCTGFSFNFQNNSSGQITGYHWDFGVPVINNDTSNSQFPSYTYTDTGVYTLTLIVYSAIPLCNDTGTAIVYVYPSLTGGIVAPNGCVNTPINFQDASISTYGDINEWLWTFGDGNSSFQQNPTHTYSNSGIYTVKLIVHTANGCADTITQSITVFADPQLNISPSDTSIIYGLSTPLNASTDVINGTFSWTPTEGLSDPNILNPIASPTTTTTYYLTITSLDGCTSIDSSIVRIVFVPIVQIPTAFSPNNDGVNDFFHPLIIGIVENADFRIYNRWGELIYQSKDAYSEGWNGKYKDEPQEIGVYVFVFNCNAAVTGTAFNFKGNVTLLR